MEELNYNAEYYNGNHFIGTAMATSWSNMSLGEIKKEIVDKNLFDVQDADRVFLYANDELVYSTYV
tara:strand:- start:97 stop:294 length:198 start_codon:yes stop_codon:yes gene_type:complete